jgi:hypothetical protein
MRPEPGPRVADATVSIGDVSVSPGTAPEAPARTRGDAMSAAQLQGAQSVARGVLDAATGGAGSRVLDVTANRLGDASEATDAAGQRQVEQQQQVAPQADAAAESVAQQRADDASRLRQLSDLAASGNDTAARQLADLALSGNQAAVEEYRRAQVQAQMTPRGGSGGGGERLTRTETTALQVPARDATSEEAAALQGARATQDQAERDAMLAMSREVEAEAGALVDTADAITRAQAEVNQLERQRQEAERARQTELRRRQAELDRMAGEVASKQIDPSRMFARGETRNRIAGAMALAFGGLADALRGGGDSGIRSALAVINQAVDRDIEAQRSNVGIAQQGVAQKRALLDDMRRTLGDEAAAEDATRALMLEGVERDIRALQLAATSDAQRAGLDRLLAEIQQQKAAARQSAIMQGIGTTDIVVQREQRQGGFGGGGRATLPDLPDTGVQLAERTRLAEQDLAAEETVRDLDNMARLLDEGALVGPIASRTPFRTALSRNARQFDRLATRLTMQMREDVLGPGQVTEAERGILFDAVGLQSELPADEVADIVREMRDKLLRRRAAMRRSVGSDAVSEAERRNPQERASAQAQLGDAAAALGGTRVR